MNGTDLLAEFRATGSEHAFSELVRRYTNLVYSVAKRQLSDTGLAEDATQAVFIRLAKAAPNIRGDAELVAWLHRTTVNASIDLWRSESRRRAREQHAVAMQPDRTENPDWNSIAPGLDQALNEINDQERQVLLLRFFDQKSMREVGLLLGISEDAAKMRVSRALDRLRGQFAEGGVTCSAVALAPLLLERSVEAAPSGLILKLAAIRWPVTVGAGTAVGLSSLFVNASKAKLVGVIASAVLVSAVVLLLFHSSQKPRRDQSANPGGQPSTTQSVEDASLVSSPPSDASSPQVQNRPDPGKLLQGVIRARQRIWSGEIEFQASFRQFEGENQTNQTRLKVVFDGAKRRFESFGREYGYVVAGPAEKEAAQIRERRLDREAAVRAGLLKAFESHHVTAFDGAVLLDYWETDGKPEQATINDPSRGPPNTSSILVFWDWMRCCRQRPVSRILPNSSPPNH
jgi:RNA polymerase sigma factor (sigma-70 family)